MDDPELISRRNLLLSIGVLSSLSGCSDSGSTDIPSTRNYAESPDSAETTDGSTTTEKSPESSSGEVELRALENDNFVVKNNTDRRVIASLGEVLLKGRAEYPVVFPDLSPGEEREWRSKDSTIKIWAPEYDQSATFEFSEHFDPSPSSTKSFSDFVVFEDEDTKISADVTAKPFEIKDGHVVSRVPNNSEIPTEDIREINVEYLRTSSYSGGYGTDWRTVGPGNFGAEVVNNEIHLRTSGSGYWNTKYRLTLASTTAEETLTCKFEQPEVDVELTDVSLDEDTLSQVEVEVKSETAAPILNPKLMIFQNQTGPAGIAREGAPLNSMLEEGNVRIRKLHPDDIGSTMFNQGGEYSPFETPRSKSITIYIDAGMNFPVDEEDNIGVLLYGTTHQFCVWDSHTAKWTNFL